MEEKFIACVDLLIALMAASNGCDAVERSFTLAKVNEMWRAVRCETLLWVKPSRKEELLVHMKGYERDHGMDSMRQMQMAETYVEKLLAFLDSNESYTSEMYKKLTVEYEDCVGAGGVDDEVAGASYKDWFVSLPSGDGNLGGVEELDPLFY